MMEALRKWSSLVLSTARIAGSLKPYGSMTLAISLMMTSCSLTPPSRDLTFVIDTSALQRASEESALTQKLYDSSPISLAGEASEIPAPALQAPSQFFASPDGEGKTLNGFSCLVVNVTGSTIPSRALPSGKVFHPQYAPKVLSSAVRVLKLDVSRPEMKVSIPMPSVGQVHVAIWGIQSEWGGCPAVEEMGSSASSSTQVGATEVYALASSDLQLKPGDSALELKPEGSFCDSPIFNRTLQNGDFKSRQREC
ncbi:MAG: hypothetical protein RJB38_1563 [Pseudomonadota bacterium]|jgi:hypothetical protein